MWVENKAIFSIPLQIHYNHISQEKRLEFYCYIWAKISIIWTMNSEKSGVIINNSCCRLFKYKTDSKECIKMILDGYFDIFLQKNKQKMLIFCSNTRNCLIDIPLLLQYFKLHFSLKRRTYYIILPFTPFKQCNNVHLHVWKYPLLLCFMNKLIDVKIMNN